MNVPELTKYLMLCGLHSRTVPWEGEKVQPAEEGPQPPRSMKMSEGGPKCVVPGPASSSIPMGGRCRLVEVLATRTTSHNSNSLAVYCGFMAALAKCNVDHFKMGRSWLEVLRCVAAGQHIQCFTSNSLICILHVAKNAWNCRYLPHLHTLRKYSETKLLLCSR